MKKKIKFLTYAGFLLIILPALLGSFKNVSEGQPGIGLQVLPAHPLVEMDAHGMISIFPLYRFLFLTDPVYWCFENSLTATGRSRQSIFLGKLR